MDKLTTGKKESLERRLKKAEYQRNRYWTDEDYRLRMQEKARIRQRERYAVMKAERQAAAEQNKV